MGGCTLTDVVIIFLIRYVYLMMYSAVGFAVSGDTFTFCSSIAWE